MRVEISAAFAKLEEFSASKYFPKGQRISRIVGRPLLCDIGIKYRTRSMEAKINNVST